MGKKRLNDSTIHFISLSIIHLHFLPFFYLSTHEFIHASISLLVLSLSIYQCVHPSISKCRILLCQMCRNWTFITACLSIWGLFLMDPLHSSLVNQCEDEAAHSSGLGPLCGSCNICDGLKHPPTPPTAAAAVTVHIHRNTPGPTAQPSRKQTKAIKLHCGSCTMRHNVFLHYKQTPFRQISEISNRKEKFC